MDPAALPPIDPLPLIGPLFIANSLNWLALGVLLVQFYYYIQHYPSDRLWIRTLVYCIFILELVQTATTTHQAWYYGVEAFNSISTLLTFPWSAMTVPTMAGIIAAVAQVFYAWRIWALSPNWVLKIGAVLVVLLALLQCTTAIVVSAIFVRNRTPQELETLHPGFETWIAASFACDVLIAVCMLWILWRVKSKSIWESSNSIIGKLIGITIGTGAAIALCGALTLGLFATTVGLSFQYLPAAYIWGKLYSNSVMVSLNSRTPQARPGNSTSQADSFPMRIQVSRDIFRDGSSPAFRATSLSGADISEIKSNSLSVDPRRPGDSFASIKPAFQDAGRAV